jgi:hypothetical protein
MSYLNAYGKKRRFQEGGVVRLRLQFKQVLNKAAVDKRKKFCISSGYCRGDQAAQLGAMLAPMILQEVQAGGGGGEEEMAPQEAQPVFRRKICRDS